MNVVYQCAGPGCSQEFPEPYPLSVYRGHFFQGRVIECPACGLKQLLQPPQPAAAGIKSVDGVLWDVEGYRLEGTYGLQSQTKAIQDIGEE